jgi:excisionase family DNA binding protein
MVLARVRLSGVQPVNLPAAPANEPMRSYEWFTAREAAEYLRLPSVKALYQRIARGQIKEPPRLGRQFRFRRRDLDALMRPA